MNPFIGRRSACLKKLLPWCLLLLVLLGWMADRFDLPSKIAAHFGTERRDEVRLALSEASIPIVRFFSLAHDGTVSPWEGDAGEMAKPLDELPLLIDGDRLVSLSNSAYQLDQEGLYRFIIPGQAVRHVILYKGDVFDLMAAIAHIHIHGWIDDGRSFSDLLKKAQQDRLILSCGSISQFTHQLLDGIGVRNRIVLGLTLDEWNSYDNGHTMIEVWKTFNGIEQWVVFDIDHQAFFLDSDGSYLSFYGLSRAINQGIYYQIVRLAHEDMVDLSGQGNEFNWTLLFTERSFIDDMSLRQWYQRVLQVPLIKAGREWLFYHDQERERIESYSSAFKYTPQEEWERMFYKPQ